MTAQYTTATANSTAFYTTMTESYKIKHAITIKLRIFTHGHLSDINEHLPLHTNLYMNV